MVHRTPTTQVSFTSRLQATRTPTVATVECRAKMQAEEMATVATEKAAMDMVEVAMEEATASPSTMTSWSSTP